MRIALQNSLFAYEVMGAERGANQKKKLHVDFWGQSMCFLLFVSAHILLFEIPLSFLREIVLPGRSYHHTGTLR